ncbi:MAG: hypothetical protein AAB396_01965 [Patescibacteria group bacterium]
MNKRIKYLPILIAIIFSNSIFTPNLSTKADFEGNLIDFNNSDALVAEYKTDIPQNKNRVKLLEPEQIKIWITAYSSTPEETDSTPFITASGSHVRNGVAAANFLPFGTKFRIPELFGNKVFVIEDRMHSRFSNRVDIWFETKENAKKFGKQFGKIEIL